MFNTRANSEYSTSKKGQDSEADRGKNIAKDELSGDKNTVAGKDA